MLFGSNSVIRAKPVPVALPQKGHYGAIYEASGVSASKVLL